MGRVVKPGEPQFLEDDTAAVIALAEEERDTCPSCGYPKAWCRVDNGRNHFDLREDFCWATYRRVLRTDSGEWKQKHEPSRAATQLSVRFAKGFVPPLDAGLDFD